MASTCTSGSSKQYITFLLAGRHFGIPALEVLEVLEEQLVTPVPLAPIAVEGLINLRGQIVPAIDMRKLLELPFRDATDNPPSVVMSAPFGAISLQVDEIGDVVELGDVAEALPSNVGSIFARYVRGVYRLNDRLLLIIDSAAICALGQSEKKQESK